MVPTCKQVGPIFAKTAEYRDCAHFFEVDFSRTAGEPRAGAAAADDPVLRAGHRLRRALHAAGLKRKLLNTQLDAFLADGKLDQLRALDPEALSPLVRFKELHGAVQALKKAPEYLKEKEATWVTSASRAR